MSDKQTVSFIDSNIWLYALIRNQDTEKHTIANQITRVNDIVISTQVINEVCTNLLKKTDFSEVQLQNLITGFYQTCTVVQFQPTILIQASKLRERYALSFWDSLIIASALSAQVTHLISEDMQAGLIIENVLEIINPFHPEILDS